MQESQSPKLDPKERMGPIHCPFASIEDSKPALHSHSLECNICIPEQPMKKH